MISHEDPFWLHAITSLWTVSLLKSTVPHLTEYKNRLKENITRLTDYSK